MKQTDKQSSGSGVADATEADEQAGDQAASGHGQSYRERQGTKFADLLLRGSFAVVKGSYFESCLTTGTPFQDRASIPQSWLFEGRAVVRMWKKKGHKFLAIVSYSWLSREHPDP